MWRKMNGMGKENQFRLKDRKLESRLRDMPVWRYIQKKQHLLEAIDHLYGFLNTVLLEYPPAQLKLHSRSEPGLRAVVFVFLTNLSQPESIDLWRNLSRSFEDEVQQKWPKKSRQILWQLQVEVRNRNNSASRMKRGDLY
jgi:hypothetical protein